MGMLVRVNSLRERLKMSIVIRHEVSCLRLTPRYHVTEVKSHPYNPFIYANITSVNNINA